ncbi:MAG TPA: histidine phosphatase family protein [Hyphomicrobium sp.]|nr:histidine phosphatase family protein [Hyphomicrobium sp.]
MLTLAILRHAKSDWDAPADDDFDRPLNSRGLKAAPQAGRMIADLGLKPSLILCSSAKRTRETLDLALPEMKLPPHTEIVTDDKLYLANFITLIEVLRDTRDVHRCVLMIGHNPGLHEFAIALAGSGDSAALTAMQDAFPTAALAIMEIRRTRWRDVRSGDGRLQAFWTPKKGLAASALQ